MMNLTSDICIMPKNWSYSFTIGADERLFALIKKLWVPTMNSNALNTVDNFEIDLIFSCRPVVPKLLIAKLKWLSLSVLKFLMIKSKISL